MSEELFTCPKCQRTGFTARGLKAHRCPELREGDRRQYLTDQQVAEALAKPLSDEYSQS